MSDRRMFLTGSRAYGTPRVDSDIDIVVLVSAETKSVLQQLSKLGKESEEGVIRLGDVNFIAETDPQQFDCWEAGTAALVAQSKALGPRSREQAILELAKAGVRQGSYQ